MRRERSHSDLSDLLSDFLRVFHSNYFYSELGIFVNCLSVQWFSGKIQRCHRWAPDSISGWCIFFLLHPYLARSIAILEKQVKITLIKFEISRTKY